MVLERPADQALAVGEKGRGEGVAGIAFVALAVEGEGQRLAAIDEAAGCETRGLAHGFASGPCMGSTAEIAWLRTLRVTTSQAWQPAVWYQSSRCRPIGLSRR